MTAFILASASPRRRELMERAGFSFTVLPSAGEEVIGDRTPEEAVRFLSRQKAREVAARVMAEGLPGASGESKVFAAREKRVVVGADTVVALGNAILGKPEDRADAKRMLRMLSGRTHVVWTGVTAILLPTEGAETKEIVLAERTEVDVAALTDGEIDNYLATGDADDKAGSYGIQGRFALHVRGIRGDYFNVMGLPLAALYRGLKENGFL